MLEKTRMTKMEVFERGEGGHTGDRSEGRFQTV